MSPPAAATPSIIDTSSSARLLPALRSDLQLHPGPVQPDGAPSWRIHDPVRNRFFEIGWLEFELLQRWQPRLPVTTLLHAVATETALQPTEDELDELLTFLTEQQLLQIEERTLRNQLFTRWMRGQPQWLTWLLHHYLFFRVPLLHPDRFLDATLPFVRPLFSRRFLVLLAVVGLLDVYVVVRQWQEVQTTFSYFFNLEGLFYYFLAASVAKVIHELGHAYTAKHFGLRVPTIGVAFLVMWPVLYTDTGETWKLTQPRQRFAIAAAGMSAEVTLALFATLGWAIAADGMLRSMLFLLATSSLLMSIAVNVSPFMRFDGYFLLSDALDMPNLHERSFALARRRLHQWFFRLETPDPEPQLTPTLRRALSVFAVATWLFRFSLFLGIALVVYHTFFKLLGIFLMLVEVVWFILRPLWREAQFLYKQRTALRPRAIAFSSCFALMLALLWLLPVAMHVSAPALLRASQEQAAYAPVAARIDALLVQPGQTVVAGQPLLRLVSPELESRRQRATSQVQVLAAELTRLPANERQRERGLVLEQQLAEAIAEQEGAQAALTRLEVRADIAGQVRDLPPQLAAGSWVNSRELLLRVVGAQGAVIEAWVSEEQVRGLESGQTVRFYPDAPESPVLRGTIVSIDPAATHALPHALMASTAGGRIPVANRDGRQVALHPLYRVRIQPEHALQAQTVERGTVRIATGPVGLAENFLVRVVAVLVRESGF